MVKYPLLFLLICFLAAPADLRGTSVFESTLDALVQKEMEEHHIPGIVLVAVQDGKLIYKKGHGFSDLETHRAVDPASTLFRVGSLSKPVTALAAMQLVESGKLDLDVPVNRFFNWLPAKDFNGNITLESLLTHTSGLDNLAKETSTLDPMDVPPLEVFLRRWRPIQVREAGESFAYSNYGFALVGQLVSTVTGETFERYIDQNILSPLGMKRSTFQQVPIPADLATGYTWEDYAFQREHVEYIKDGPSGALVSSGEDMALLLQTLLRSGAPLIKKETFEKMVARHFGVHPKIPGIAFGLFESLEPRWGLRALRHSGAVDGFGSYLYFSQDEKFGFFLSGNSMSATKAARAVRLFFLHHLYGSPGEIQKNIETWAPKWTKLVGKYRPQRSTRAGLAKLQLLRQEIDVGRKIDGSLDVEREEKREWTPIAPGLFQSSGYEGVLTEYVYFDLSGIEPVLFIHNADAYEKLAWYQTSVFHMIFSSLLLLLSFFSLARFFKKMKRKCSITKVDLPFIAMGFLNAICILGIALAVAIGRFDRLEFKMTLWEQVFLSIPWLSIGFTTLGLALVFRPGLAQKVRMVSLMTSLVTLGYFYHWNVFLF